MRAADSRQRPDVYSHRGVEGHVGFRPFAR